MKVILRLSVVMVLFLFLNSCKKEDAKTKTQLLTQKEWVMKKLEQKEGSNPWVDEFLSFDACSKDDRYVFKANGTYEFNEGPTKCDPADPQVFDTGNWIFTNNETKLQIGTDEFTIDTLDENNLILSVQETVGGIAYQLRVTFGRP
jgi:hypothetical protein